MVRKIFYWVGILALVVMPFHSQVVSAPGADVLLRGHLSILWGDGSYDTNESREIYFLHLTDGSSIQLIIDGLEGVHTLDRREVIVRGFWITPPASGKGVLRVLSIKLDLLVAEDSQGVYGPQPWVSVLCKFADVPAEPKGLPYFQGMYSDTYPGLDHYWREQSYDQANVEGSGAFGWYVLPQPRSYYVYNDQLDWGRAAEDCTGVADDDIYFPDYVGINLMFNDVLDCCAWGGQWYLCRDGVCQSWRMTWEPPWGYENIGVIAHETGHGFGLPHSSGDYGETYDNQWDVMSGVWSNCDRGGIDPVFGCLGQGTITFHKDLLEWIQPAQWLDVGVGTEITVTVERLAIPESDGYLGIQLPINDSQVYFYTVETRRFTGYDSYLPGEAVILHRVDIYRDNPAHVLDVDGDGDTGDEGAMWVVGETYLDADYGIEISVISQTASGFVVRVKNGGTPIENLTLEGTPTGTVGVPIPYTATVTPIDAFQPITYTWQAMGLSPVTHVGGIEDVVAFTWTDPGTKVITVTAENSNNAVSQQVMTDIYLPPAAVVMEGDNEGVVHEGIAFTASISPISATLPITYSWQVEGLGEIVHQSGITDTAVFTWTEPGLYTLTLTAVNQGGEVRNTHPIRIYASPQEVAMVGAESGWVGVEQFFTATIFPITTTVPLTYVWTINGQGVVTHTNGLTDTFSYVWDSPGAYQVTVYAENRWGSADSQWLNVISSRVYLPLLVRK